MTIKIEIYGDNAAQAVGELKTLVRLLGGTGLNIDEIRAKNSEKSNVELGGEAVSENKTVLVESEKEKKTRKPKEEKIVEPKAEVLPPEKAKYTLQDAIDRAREVAGDGKDENVMQRLKAINVKLGIAKVREIPVDKLDTYMSEINKEFPLTAPAAEINMFD